MKRSKHSLSHNKLLSCNMGNLIPIGLVEVLPGDTFQHSTKALLRVAPLLSPVMHKVDVRIHHFFVPHRIIWDEWEDFITGGSDGDSVPSFPVINMPAGTGAATSSLADYLGVPTGIADLEVSALPFRAYSLIFNEFFRDEDLVSELTVSKASGTDTTTNTTLRQCAWEKDYFTSCRPWTQKGPEISIPLTGNAPVRGLGTDTTVSYAKTSGSIRETGGVTTAATAGAPWTSTSTTNWFMKRDDTNTGFPNVYADLSDVTAASVNDLRLALALQRYEEARARYGSRYVEYLRALGVRSSDSRLQRPEYLGGGREVIQFSEVLQTAEGTDPVGEMRGHGIAAMRTNRYRRFFEEHGYVITLLSVRPKTVYMQGLFRTWNRRTKEDFFQPELQHIGQQEVLNKELYAGAASPSGVFGYQDRYDEYRYHESSVSGEFRTSQLNYWHMGRDFSSAPTLNGDFVKCVPTNRIFAATNSDQLYIMAKHSLQARRIIAPRGNSFIF